jgi:hypothetical protein
VSGSLSGYTQGARVLGDDAGIVCAAAARADNSDLHGIVGSSAAHGLEGNERCSLHDITSG